MADTPLSERLVAILAELPDKPGVYQMLNAKGDVIYVGKAKSLKKRVKSYFQKKDGLDVKTRKLVSHITDIHYVIVASEQEALILESNFIREKKPRFNVLLRDDQRYVYIKVTNEDFPQILKVRHVSKDGARYFGPFTYASPVVASLRFIEKLFSLRNCTHKIDWNEGNVINYKATRSIPCLEYHIKKCSGPCIGEISISEYRARIDKALRFLEGEQEFVIKDAQDAMQKAAAERKFEKAASLRDQLADLAVLQETQHINTPLGGDFDAVGYFQMLGKIGVNVFQIRNGKLINQENLLFDERVEGTTSSEIIERFLMDFYPTQIHLPREILLPCEIENNAVLADAIGVKLFVPAKGDKRSIVDLSIQNAKSWMEQNKIKWMTEHSKTIGAAAKLASALGIGDKQLRRIECFDISHIQGTNTVGSMVVFQDGKPANKHYRLFDIKSVEDGTPNDFQSMMEVLGRRLQKLDVPRGTTGLEVRRALKSHFTDIGIEALPDTDDVSHFYAVCIVDDTVIGWGRLEKHIGKNKKSDTFWMKELHCNQSNDQFDILLALARFLLKHAGRVRVYSDTAIDSILLDALGFVAAKDKKDVWVRNGKSADDISFTDIPDLLIIDGGKGQLSSVMKIMDQLDLTAYIPVCALAKREEELFLPGESEPIVLPRGSDELYLVQRLRDEAHRFAITAHRNKRSKTMVRSALDDISGIGPKTRSRLFDAFGDVAGIEAATEQQLAAIVGGTIARRLWEHFH